MTNRKLLHSSITNVFLCIISPCNRLHCSIFFNCIIAQTVFHLGILYLANFSHRAIRAGGEWDLPRKINFMVFQPSWQQIKKTDGCSLVPQHLPESSQQALSCRQRLDIPLSSVICHVTPCGLGPTYHHHCSHLLEESLAEERERVKKQENTAKFNMQKSMHIALYRPCNQRAVLIQINTCVPLCDVLGPLPVDNTQSHFS
ncbi:uncharacterized protein LOC121892386 [Thunnus maccoyii]|uniref:uncharacterized protein LOC121892386 n=1 Tax=Thunnus maccoyii TaxID=8240 RepID=UPI001C4AAD8D|nr:uncharacterized protein LOC121892386 [Thunnus maccoyii]